MTPKSNVRTDAKMDCFRPLAGMKMVYDPACRAEAPLKKNPCPDCYHCQFCSDDRCNACRGGKYKQSVSSCRKLSVQEQIVLYDRINSQDIAE